MDVSNVSEQDRLAALKPILTIRAHAVRAARNFFEKRDFLEVETPVRVCQPALELHVDAEISGEAFLRTSPELHMKRLLASGYQKIFQMGKCFRKNERGMLHNPEFTMLEWYRSQADYMDIMADAKALILSMAKTVLGRTRILFRDINVELDGEWRIMTVSNAFSEYAGWDPVADYDPDRFDIDLIEKIEPRMLLNRPVVLIDFPAEAAALARLKQNDPRVAERWELYIAGVELINAFSELLDPVEQRRRFQDCAQKRKSMGKPVYEIDEAFMASLERDIPPAAGAALGIDRLAMVLCGSTSLDDLLPFR